VKVSDRAFSDGDITFFTEEMGGDQICQGHS